MSASQDTAGQLDRPRRPTASDRRRDRESRIIAATRELFDARGVRDAQIEDVARAVGVNRAIIYRHFTGKEELFALTEADYLRDLQERLRLADDDSCDPETRLRTITEVFVDFGLSHPAFVDCGVTLMRMGPALLDELSPSALMRLGAAMTGCLAHVVRVIEAGNEAGTFAVENPPLAANSLYALGLGGLQLARLGVIVHQGSPGVPEVSAIDPGAVKAHLMTASLAIVRPPS
jgi:AcrR family transcriptional regulator